MKKLLVAIVAVMMLLTATACKKTPKMAEDQTLYMTFAQNNLKTNNDFLHPWQDGTILNSLIWRTLIKADENLEAKKDDLMTNWKISEDGLTVTMELRDKQYWSDGKPITMDDVMFTMNCWCNQYGTASWSYVRNGMKYIEGFDAYSKGEADSVSGLIVDGNKLTIKLTTPYDSFLNLLCQVAVLPVHIYGNVNLASFIGDDIWQELPCTSGMYKVTEHVQGSYFILEPNEYYKDATPYIKKIVFNVTNDSSVSAQAGQCDYFQTDSADHYAVMSSLSDYTLHPVPVIYYRFLVFNLNDKDGNNKGIVSDPKIRQAFAYAIDWKSLIGGLYGDMASFTQAGVLSSSKYYAGDWYSYDPAKAKQLLQEANYDFDHELRIVYYYSDQTTKDVMDGIVYYLQQIGLKADAVYTTNTNNDIYGNKLQDAAYMGLSAYDNLSWYQMYKRAAMQGMWGEGYEKYVEKTNELEKAVTDSSYNEIIKTLQKWESEDVFFLPVYSLNYQSWVNNRVEIGDTKFGNGYFFYDYGFENWYIK